MKVDDIDLTNACGHVTMEMPRHVHRRHVHVLIRGPDLAASMSRYLIRRIDNTASITLHRQTQVVALGGETHLEQVTWRDAEGAESTHPIRHLFTMAGARPNTAWLRGAVLMVAQGFVITSLVRCSGKLDGRSVELPICSSPVGRASSRSAMSVRRA